MKYIIKAIHDFFDPLENVYVNPHKVVFTLMIDEICMSAPWPGFNAKNNVALELVYNSGTLSQFIKEMAITNTNDLDRITPSHLIDLYMNGKASVFCLVDQKPGYRIYFRRHNGKIMVTGDHMAAHTVYASLKTAADFIKYVDTQYSLTRKGATNSSAASSHRQTARLSEI